MSKRGDKRRKKQKEQRHTNRNSLGYFEELEYCCNLDDDEYNCLWECYDIGKQSLLSQVTNFFKRIFNCHLV